MREDLVVIFDIDGTLANIEHRKHYVATKPKNWPAFEKALPYDTLHEDIAWFYHKMATDFPLYLVSGRGEQQRKATNQWLDKHGLNKHRDLYMRPAKDYRQDYIIKEEIYNREFVFKGLKVFCVFDDRDQVVSVWRHRGVRVLQVADGNF